MAEIIDEVVLERRRRWGRRQMASSEPLASVHLFKAQKGRPSRKIEDVFVDPFLDAQPAAPQEIILDLDATDNPLHGQREA